MKRTRIAALPVTVLGAVGAVGASPAAAVAADEPDPVDATAPTSQPLVRPVPPDLHHDPGEGILDVPAVAQAAYGRAATVLAAVDTTCGLDAELLAAIGRVETDHGRYAAWKLGPRARMFPLLIGAPVPDPAAAALPDTDGGAVDRDPLADHPVGPFQILPSTWQQVAVDGDSDGLRSPGDLDDAALAVGIVLCTSEQDLATPEGRATALRGLNDSPEYVAGVEHFLAAYLVPVPVAPVSVTTIATVIEPPADTPAEPKKPKAAHAPAAPSPAVVAPPPAPVEAPAPPPAPPAAPPVEPPIAEPPAEPVATEPPAPEPSAEPAPVVDPTPVVETVVVETVG